MISTKNNQQPTRGERLQVELWMKAVKEESFKIQDSQELDLIMLLRRRGVSAHKTIYLHRWIR